MAGRTRYLLVSAVAVSVGLVAAGPSSAQPATAVPVKAHKVGLGKVVTTADGGQIFGWDINQNGTDGVLASSQDTSAGYQVSVETFDQRSATITSSFAVDDGPRNTYGVDGIFANDVGLVTHYIVPKGSIFAKRRYDVMDPVTAQSFTGAWTPPITSVDVKQAAVNQTTTTSVVYTIELKKQDLPDLVVSDLAANTSKLIHLDPALSLNDDPQLAQQTATNQAVLAYSPDSGAVGGLPPKNLVVNLASGHTRTFSGFNSGFFHAGAVNGIAVDSTTGIECTTTELNSQVEFYNIKRGTGIVAVQLPGTGDTDQLTSGAAIANDPVNHLFLVADPDFAPTGGSAIVVYDEKGSLIESIPGFHFSNSSTVVPIRVAVNPARRTGWVDGPGIDQIQQFFY